MTSSRFDHRLAHRIPQTDEDCLGPCLRFAAFHLAQLRDNSCVLQLRVFCFLGSSRTSWVPPIKQPLALEAEATRFRVPQENGARKRRNFSYVLPQLYNSRRVCWFCPGATSSERQRFEIHR